MRSETLQKILSLAVLVALVGGVAALWSDMLKIQMEITTGEVEVVFGEVGAYEEPEFEGKDVGKCSVMLIDGDDDDGDAILQVIIENAYPSYECVISFEVKNIGTIPVKGPYFAQVEYDSTALEITLPDIVQIHPGESEVFEIRIHVLQEALEETTYNVSILMIFAQWNEAPQTR